MKNEEKLNLAKNYYIGKIYITNENYKITVIGYENKKKVSIQFENGYITNVMINNIKKGAIKNPYHPSVFNLGYYGVGKYRAKINRVDTKSYKTWYNMFLRCYSKKIQEKQPTYTVCSIDERWHNFQNFAEWYEENYKEGFQLDKDILIKGNKIYSPETCCFVPQKINILFIKNNINRGKYPIGVVKEGNRYIACLKLGHGIQKYLGTFDTIEEAFNAYKIAKEAYIKEVANKWKDQITEECYEAMYNYKVEITD